jgi:hypothetical protein
VICTHGGELSEGAGGKNYREQRESAQHEAWRNEGGGETKNERMHNLDEDSTEKQTRRMAMGHVDGGKGREKG